MDYEELYWDAKSRYNNAYREANACKRRIDDLNSQKRKVVNEINQLKSEEKRIVKAIDQLQNIIQRESRLNEKLREIKKKIDNAAVNYSRMVDSSDVTNRNLNDVYDEEGRRNAQEVEKIISVTRTKLNKLTQTLDEIRRKRQNAESELDNINRSIRSNDSAYSDWIQRRNNASYEAAYYKKRMAEGY